MNLEHLAILKQGVEHWNKWRSEHLDITPDLECADLRGMNLTGTNLGPAGYHFEYTAQMYPPGCLQVKSSFTAFQETSPSNLGFANLMYTNLTNADLRRANLRGANLCLSMLAGANLRGADVTDTYLGHAIAAHTIFAELDLSVAKYLEIARHLGPSTLGIDTLYKSRGKIPAIFLRGCGVPEEFIRIAQSLKENPTECYSCVISYSTKDQAFADRLYVDLQATGVRCWLAPHDIKGGRKIHEQIDEAIRLHDKLLLILPEASMGSEWVKEKIARARKREADEKRQRLFPITLVPYDSAIKNWECFDADRGKDSAREIREYFIPDFSDSKSPDSYQAAFQRLVKDLKS